MALDDVVMTAGDPLDPRIRDVMVCRTYEELLEIVLSELRSKVAKRASVRGLMGLVKWSDCGGFLRGDLWTIREWIADVARGQMPKTLAMVRAAPAGSLPVVIDEGVAGACCSFTVL